MFWIFAPYLYYQIISYCATTQYGVIIPYMNSDCRRKSFWPPARARRKGVSRGEFRRARAFRRSETEAVSSVQNRFGFGQTNAPELNFQEFCRLIQPREARPISSGKFPKVKFWCPGWDSNPQTLSSQGF